jgi:hypothetical protein
LHWNRAAASPGEHIEIAPVALGLDRGEVGPDVAVTPPKCADEMSGDAGIRSDLHGWSDASRRGVGCETLEQAANIAVW